MKNRIYGRGRDGFVTALDSAIRVHFGGKDAAFAAALGVSGGRVSQIFNGPYTIDRKAINHILSAIPRGSERDGVMEAWERDFLTAGAPDALTGVLCAEEALATAFTLEGEGRLRQARSLLAGSLVSLPDPERGPVYARAIQLDMQLGDPGGAALLLREAEAETLSEPFDRLTLMWLRGLVLRASGASASRMIAAYRRAAAFARERSAGLPRRSAGRWRLRELEAARDEAIALMTAPLDRPPSREELERAWALARRSADEAPDASAQSVGLEVVARAELGLGRLLNCEDTLGEAVRLSGGWPDMAQKAGLIRAEILVHDKEANDAKDLLAGLSAKAVRDGSVHYERAAKVRLAQLTMGVEPGATSRAVRARKSKGSS